MYQLVHLGQALVWIPFGWKWMVMLFFWMGRFVVLLSPSFVWLLFEVYSDVGQTCTPPP